ncbi:unnamed protein product [Leuciscus chuanchicus]
MRVHWDNGVKTYNEVEKDLRDRGYKVTDSEDAAGPKTLLERLEARKSSAWQWVGRERRAEASRRARKWLEDFRRTNPVNFKGSIVIDSVLEFDSTNGTSPNVTDVKDTLVTAITNGSFNFTIIQNATSIAEINLVFSIVQQFKDIYSNLSSPETIDLSNSITTACSRVYKNRFPKFYRMFIRKFSKGSIVIDSVLEFDSTNGTSPNATDVIDTLVTAITNGSFNFTIIQNATSIAEVTPQNQSTTAATPATTPVTNQTATPVTNQTATPVTTVSAPAKVAQINLVFSIVQQFKDIYSNLSNPETIDLSNSITTACSRVYKSRFPKFHRMFIRKFSKGSIVTDSVLEFDSTNGTSPNVTDVKDTLDTAITNGSFTFTIIQNATSIAEVTPQNQSTTATTVSAASALTNYNITFKLNDDFTNDLSNITSDGAKKLVKNITSELDGFYNGFKNFKRSLVWRFRSGSIAVDGLLGFNNSLANNPTASELARGLAGAVRNGIVKLPVDPKTIVVTDSSGFAANRSPVLASMLTALWMTLASLLLSAVMH